LLAPKNRFASRHSEACCCLCLAAEIFGLPLARPPRCFDASHHHLRRCCKWETLDGATTTKRLFLLDLNLSRGLLASALRPGPAPQMLEAEKVGEEPQPAR